MMTKLLLHRGGEHSVRDMESASVFVPRCPMFDFDRENERVPELVALLADGWRISGHVDGISDEAVQRARAVREAAS